MTESSGASSEQGPPPTQGSAEPIPEPTSPPMPSAFDVATAKQLEANDAARLTRAREQAKNWLPALTSLTALVATVVVLKGPDAVTDLKVWQRLLVTLLGGVAFAALARGVWQAYTAQFGEPGTDEEMDVRNVVGLHSRVLEKQRDAATAAHGKLRSAVGWTIAGLVLVVVANAVTWYPQGGSAGKDTCVTVGGQVVAKIKGSSVDVKKLQGAEVDQCD